MFAMCQPECQPSPGTAVVIVQYMTVNNFRPTLRSTEYSSPLHMILSSWVTRTEAGPPGARLKLAEAYELPEGREPALEIVESPNQVMDVQSALLFLASYGAPADIKAIEGLLENSQQLASSRVGQADLTTETRDVALAILWKMHGESASHHGMHGYVEVSGRPKLGTIGFTSNEARGKALGEWRAWRRANVKADLPPDGRAVEGQST
jgi:hypothetical protein